MKKFYLLFTFFLASLTAEIHAQITCDFTFQNNGPLCAPYFLSAVANETSSATVTERCWKLTLNGVTVDSGCANQSTYPYIAPMCGIYCLRLWSQNANGDTCSITKCITVSCSPDVDFTFSPTEICLDGCVQAQCNSTPGSGVINSVQIDWGCGPITSLSSCPVAPITFCYNSSICSFGTYSPTVIVTNSFGCNGSETYPNLINVIPPPVACFTADTTAVYCTSVPLPVNFTACNAGPNMTYSWYIDGILMQIGLSRLFSFVFPINNADCYDVKLVVRHASGCADSLTVTNYICNSAVPQICFTANGDTACAPFTLVLTNCTPGITNLSWTLNGPGGPYTAFGPVGTFPLTQCGVYIVTVTAVFAQGCTATLTRQVLVLNCPPNANFTVSDTFGCKLPHCVTFTAVPCTGCTYEWTLFGCSPNTQFGTIPVANCCLIALGSWSTVLRVRAPNGCMSTVSKPNAVTIREINPVIGVNANDGCAPVCGFFDDLTNYSLIPDTISSICWSFPGSLVPGGCGDTIQRCFNAPGCYDVRLIVGTTTGCVDTTTLIDTLCVGTAPVCVLTVLPDTLCFEQEPVVVSLNCDSFDCAKVIWGDGDVTIECDPVFEHFYQDTGCITSCVIPYRNGCAADTIFFTVCVLPTFANFTTSYICTNDTVSFINQSVGNNNYLWTFCNGDTSTLRNPSLLLPPCDTCTVTLQVSDTTNGCVHSKTSTINTSCGQASISPTIRNICASRIVTTVSTTFTNTSTSSDPSQTRWDFDIATPPGYTQTGTTVTAFYNAPGNYTLGMINVTAAGCRDTVYANVKICKPIANFSVTNICFTDSVCFTDLTVDQLCNITFRRWSFGDGTIDTVSANPCHVYPGPGTYNVELFIRNDMGCRDSLTRTVIIAPHGNLNYSIDTSVCPGEQQCVINNSTGAVFDYQWQIPSAVPYDTVGEAPCFIITAAGDYWIYVNIFSNGCLRRDSTLVHVCSPVASGYVSDNFFSCPNPPSLVLFTNTAQCADAVTWIVGDVHTSSSNSFNHYFTYPGCYPITQIACNGTCCDTTIVDTICVLGPHISSLPTSPLSVCACKDTVHFSFGTVGVSAATFIYGCSQGFAQVNPVIPIGTSQSPTVLDFTIRYCITDSCQPQIILGDTVGCLVYYELPKIYADSADADFTANTTGVCISGTVCFNDNSHYALPQNHSVQWLWSFGDGVTDTTENPCHYYSTQGIYTVTLRVVSNAGCIDSVFKQIIIHGYPTANFGYVVDDSCNSTIVCFHDSSSADAGGVITDWLWCFGDGTCDTSGASPCHTYLSEGTFAAVLTIADENGCADSDTASVIVNFINDIRAAFVYSVTNGFVQFTNTSSGTFNTAVWNFGDGASSSQINTVHPYTVTGTYAVTLTITDANGCTDDTTITITVIISSINEIVNEVEVKIVPNPFSDFTNIQVKGAEGEYSFRVISLVGAEITNAKLKSNDVFRLYRDKLASGLYLFEVSMNNKLLKRGKIVLQ